MTEEMHPDAKYTNKQISLCIPLHHLKEVVMEERLNHTVSSIANGTSCLILAYGHFQSNICDMCVQGRGKKAISVVI